MARIRTVKPEFWTSEQIMECSPTARLLFIGLWNFCDDAGNHPANIKRVKAEVFPGDDLAISSVEHLIEELLEHELVFEYESAGKSYWHVIGWHHQKIDKPTIKHPAPPEIRLAVAEGSPSIPLPLDNRSPPDVYVEGSKPSCAISSHVSKGKSNDEDPQGFSECWDAYPKRLGGNSRAEASKAYRARLKAGVLPADLLAGVQRYAAYVRAKGCEGTEFVKQSSTFFGKGEHWREAWEPPSASSNVVAKVQAGLSKNAFAGAI